MVTSVLFMKLRKKINVVEKSSALLYYKCQWENKRREVSVLYLSYRWIHLIIILLCILLSLFNHEGFLAKWPIYLTNWALFLYFSQALMAVYIVTNAYYCIRKGKTLDSSDNKLLPIYGALQSCAVVLAFGVSFVYWCFVHDSEIHKMNVVNISSHIFNSIIMLIDLMMIAHPVKMLDIIFPLLFTLTYTAFNIIYFFCGGTDRRGNPYVYKVMDWRQPLNAVLFVHGGLLLLIIIFIFVWIFSYLRKTISRKFEATHVSVPQQEPFELSIA